MIHTIKKYIENKTAQEQQINVWLSATFVLKSGLVHREWEQKSVKVGKQRKIL